MTPAQQWQSVSRDTGTLKDLTKPENLVPVLGSIGGLLTAVNAKSPMVKTAGVILTVGAMFWGIINKPVST